MSVSGTLFFVYAATAARSFYWGDGGELVAVARTLGIAHPPGYPLYTLLGALAVRVPIGDPFFRLSLMSAIFGAAACGVLVLLAHEIVGFALARAEGRASGSSGGVAGAARTAASIAAGLLLGFSPAFWAQATVPEVYTLSAFLSLSLLLLIMWWLRSVGRSDPADSSRPSGLTGERSLLIAGFALGLSLSHHLTAALLLPTVGVLLLWAPSRRPPWRLLAGAAGLAVAGLTPYVYLFLRAGHDPAILWAETGTVTGLTRHIAGAQYASRLFAAPWIESVHRLGVFAGNLPSEISWVALACAALGVSFLWRHSRPAAVAFTAAVAAVVLHAAGYRIPDIEAYYIPAYAVLAALAASGIAAVLGTERRIVAVGASWALIVALAISLAWQVGGDWQGRDLSGCADGARYVRRLLDPLPEGSIVLAQEDRTVFPLWYARFVEGDRADVAVLDIRAKSPHLAKWFPSVRFPSEGELAAFYGATQVVPCSPPGREFLSIGEYLPLLVDVNADRPVFSDYAIARGALRDRAAPAGLLARIGAAGAAPADTFDLLGERPWAEYIVGLNGASQVAREAYAKTLADVGRFYLTLQLSEEAVSVLERARDLAPWIPETHNNLGVAYYGLEMLEAATEEFERALELNPGLAGAHHNIAEAYATEGDSERALAELEAAAALDPASVRYRVELGTLYESAGDLDRAERMFDEAERVAPDDWVGAMALGDFLARGQRYSEAVAAYRRAERLNPAEAGVQRGIGRCYWAMDDVGRAIEAMDRSVELQPQNPRLKYDLAMMMSEAGRQDAALDLLTDVVRLMPNSWKAFAARARLLGSVGRHGEARRDFAHAARLGAEGEAFWSTWGAMERAAGDTARAQELESRARGVPTFTVTLDP